MKDNPSFNYEWDGKFLKPSKDSTSFGAGMWNGEIVSWYKKDWMIFKTSKRDETFRYECKGNSFEPTKPGFPRWILDNKVMKSDTVSGEWYLDELTKVPQVLAILFQLLRYIKVGLDAHNSSTPQPTQVQISSNINNNVPIGPSQPQNQSNSSSIYPIPQELAIPQGKRIKITCQLNNWTFRIPISENATISHLIQEISRRSSRRLVLLEESLSRRRDEILKIMDRLATAVALDDEAEEATMVVRLFVESIKDQIVECQQMAISQTKVKFFFFLL